MVSQPTRSTITGARRAHITAVAAYALVALAFAWPLPAHLTTFLPSPPDGDAGVYVWNQWVFHHELVQQRSNPYVTTTVLAPTGPAFLSLHNYTEVPNALALPFIGPLGMVAAFNVVYLLLGIWTAHAMFLLVRRLSPGAGAEAWLAGAVFAWSPMLVARSASHLSLVAAAPLPLFVLALLRADQYGRARDGLLLGAIAAVAAFCDAYYAIYCGLMAAAFLAAKAIRVEPRASTTREWPGRGLDALILAVLGGSVWIAATGGVAFTFAGQEVSFRSLYTPSLVLVLLGVARVFTRYRCSVPHGRQADVWRTVRLGLWAAAAALLILAPRLYGVAIMASEGRVVPPAILWRSSPPGVDALAFLLPNPNHPFVPGAWRAWVAALPNGFEENVASVPLVVLGVLLGARLSGWRAPRPWPAMGIVALLLALGPFLRVGTVNTALPGPWALLRYVPVVELARSPTRLAILVMLVAAVLFALALRSLGTAYPARRRALFAVVGVLLLFELLPAPRTLSSAEVPRIYAQVANDPRDTAHVLELPFGLRDGTSSHGDFSARTQYAQTAHGKPILGGYLSRLSPRRINATRGIPLLDVLMRLSEGQQAPPGAAEAVAPGAREFLTLAGVEYVVIDRARASPALVEFAVPVLELELLEVDGAFELYRPRTPALARTSPSGP